MNGGSVPFRVLVLCMLTLCKTCAFATVKNQYVCCEAFVISRVLKKIETKLCL